MPLVRITKAHGFEQVGDIVDYRGDVDAAVADGAIELLDVDPRLPVTSETIEEAPIEEAVLTDAAPIEEVSVTEPEPVVEAPVETPAEPVVEAPVEETPTEETKEETLDVNVEGA